VVIENVAPSVDGGRFPVKRVVGDALTVEADAFADGHDEIRVALRWCGGESQEWHEQDMEPLGNDRWRAAFPLESVGRYEYNISAWVDRWETWRHDLKKRVDAGQDVAVDLQIGSQWVAAAAERAAAADADALRRAAAKLKVKDALGEDLDAIVEKYPDRSLETTLPQALAVTVDPPLARFSAWYELFPRSASPDPKRHGTFRDVVARLGYVQDLGFDVLYLPPISPIGLQFRKGANNRPSEDPSDPGVPWAIGGPEGGHTAIHPDLGSLDDFRALVSEARRRGIEIALDVAFQASPDHPWVTEHPNWFRARPDGTIQYAENPPKKYQDIYPFDFESQDWRGLWQALNDVFRFWIAQGVAIFRVDNPHTKSFVFWEWCITDIKRDHPETLFLAEAFTRPKVMYRLAKLGFSQSYTYFTWRNSAHEMREYLEELTSPPVNQFFRPNFWPNTPDILHADLQTGARAAFEARLVMAATLSSNYGIYGPAFELMEHTPREPGTEEYLDSEKYQQRTWNLERRDSLAPFLAAVNQARREHPALQSMDRLWFHPIDNENLLAYTKNTEDQSDVILAVVNFDYLNRREGVLELGVDGLGLPSDRPYHAVDLLDGTAHEWVGSAIPIDLDPAERGALLFSLRPV
jgi:starch synthase (maltosyl-transferring)